MRHLGARLGAHKMVEPARKLALARIREVGGEKLRHRQSQHAVAEELEPLIVLVGLGGCPRACVG